MSTKKLPKVGARVMRVYGRKDYAEYGEVGTVTAHNPDGKTFQMTLDDVQPFWVACFGAKGKRSGWGATVHKVLNLTEVEPLAKVYRENARRLRAVAKVWDEKAREAASEVTP